MDARTLHTPLPPSQTATADIDVSALITVMGQLVKPNDDTETRVRWLLDVAAALDTLAFDGVAELAAQARSDAVQLVKTRIAWVAGRQ